MDHEANAKCESNTVCWKNFVVGSSLCHHKREYRADVQKFLRAIPSSEKLGLKPSIYLGINQE